MWLCVFICFVTFVCQKKYCDVARRRATSYDVVRLLLMVPLVPWRNSTPFFGAAAFCTTKIGDFRASSMSSSLTTWSTYSSKRRPLRKNQLGGTKRRYSLLFAHTPHHIPLCGIFFWILGCFEADFLNFFFLISSVLRLYFQIFYRNMLWKLTSYCKNVTFCIFMLF